MEAITIRGRVKGYSYFTSGVVKTAVFLLYMLMLIQGWEWASLALHVDLGWEWASLALHVDLGWEWASLTLHVDLGWEWASLALHADLGWE